MKCNFKRKNNSLSTLNASIITIDFSLKRAVQHGKAIFVCGNIK
jgi:hypothetical protein